ncbi:MAG: hypothetical protein KDC12_14920, partial [Flavobacteriales bacterium]|nr:hypothetical protein [Flavobacteriales bacterium]
MKRDLTLIAGVLLIASSMHSQMMVDADITPEEAVQEVLLGDGVTPFNVIFIGGTEQMGTFTAGNEAIDMFSGI